MEMYKAQRLRAFIDHLRAEGIVYNDTDFCLRVNKNRAIISEMTKGKRNITPQAISDIRAVFPELNPDWLSKRECNRMLINGPADIESSAVPEFPSASSGELERLHRIIEQQQATIDRLLRLVERLQGNE